ncbi:hypothetical protein [Planomicrobium soli]|nr:hypothetical protein [Planomicrobium soli]
MNFFTNDKNDIDGYREQLHHLKSRLDENVHRMTYNNQFHDAQIDFLGIKNEFNEEVEQEKLPISLECRLMDSDGEWHEIVWEEVKKFLLDYDLTRHTYWGSTTISGDGLRGLDDWMWDEITPYDEEFLSHEIILASEMKIVVHCKNIKLRQIK